MALRKFVERITKPVEEADREQLVGWCNALGADPLDRIELRKPARVAGVVDSVRVVPRAGADSLEVVVSDGRSRVTAVFLGRRKITGMSVGRKVVLEGTVAAVRSRRVLYNPLYTLL
jgi:RecG-like helicase